MAENDDTLLAAAACGDEDAARAALVPVVSAFGPLVDSAGKPVYNTECADKARARGSGAALARARHAAPRGQKTAVAPR